MKNTKTVPDAFEQSIEDNAENHVPLSKAKTAGVEAIIERANKTKNIKSLLQNSVSFAQALAVFRPTAYKTCFFQRL